MHYFDLTLDRFNILYRMTRNSSYSHMKYRLLYKRLCKSQLYDIPPPPPNCISMILVILGLFYIYIYIQYTYIVGKYKIYLYELQKQAEQRAFGELFRPVSQRVQIYFIFNDNVRILCLSCNVKKVGKLVRFKQKDRNKRHSSPFINVVKGVFFVVRVTLVPVSYLSAPSAVHSYGVPGKFIRRLKSLFVG